MKRQDLPSPEGGALEYIEGAKRKSTRLEDLVEQGGVGIDKKTFDTLRLILEQNEHLAHVEIIFISPEEEPNTGGFFHRVQVDEDTFVPTISIVREDQAHMRRLKNIRSSSARRIADMLGADFSQLTPSLLRQFIIAHEFGHAKDYVTNYETNPAYRGADAAEEWNLHYRSNLLTMPVPGFDPVTLREEASRFISLKAFFSKYSDVAKTTNARTLQDLLREQEIAYRNSAYESYADNFATSFLKNNAEGLDISELLGSQGYKEAA